MFLSPLFLWAGLFALPLIGLFFLKVRPRRYPTTTLFLWQQLLEQKVAQSWLRRLRQWWSLILLLLVVAAVTFALARPRFSGSTLQDLLVIVDRSASMGTLDDRGVSRLERARQQVADIVRGLAPDQRAMVASVGEDFVFHSFLTTSQHDLLDALQEIKLGAEENDPRLLTEIVADRNPWRENVEIIYLTDGSSGSVPNHADLHVQLIEDTAENIGIVAADVQPIPGGQYQLLYQVMNASAQALEAELHLAFGDPEMVQRIIPLALEPGLNAPATYVLEAMSSGPWWLSLHGPEGFDDRQAMDDQVPLMVHPVERTGVAIHSYAPFFLQRCVDALATSGRWLRYEPGQPDIIVAQQGAPDHPLLLLLQPTGSSPWWHELGDELIGPEPTALVQQHALLSHVADDDFNFTGARSLQAPEHANVLIADALTATPLLYHVRQGDASVIVLNCDPMADSFVLSPTFPIFLHDALVFLSGTALDQPAVVPTQTLWPQFADDTELVSPGGDRIAPREPLTEAGHYRLVASDTPGVAVAAAALLRPGESATQGFTSPAPAASTLAVQQGWPLAIWLALLAMVVLALEAVLYHRRWAG